MNDASSLQPESPGAKTPDSATSTALIPQLAQATGIEVEELKTMLEAMNRGESLHEYFGLPSHVLAAYENAAVSYFSNQLYEQAEPIFWLLIALSQNERSSAWRGVAACRHALLDYDSAIQAYIRAIELEPSDSLSATYLAECLLLTGERDSAIGVLRALLEEGDKRNDAAPHIKRARAMLKSALEDTTPLKRRADSPTPRTTAPPSPAPGAGATIVPEPEPNDPEIQAFMALPGVRDQLEQLSNLFHRGAVTLRDIADFSQEQIDAGYAVCCTLLEQQSYPRCLEMCGWMLHVDSHDARFYQLAGLAAMNLEMHCLAEHMFNMDSIWRTEGPDAATLVYKGEALIRQHEVPEGLATIAEGIALAGSRREYREVVQRGQLLQQVYAKPAEATPA